MSIDEARIKAQIDALLNLPPKGIADVHSRAAELVSGAVTLLTLVHGAGSPQVKTFNETIAAHQKLKEASVRVAHIDEDTAIGALNNLKREIEGGLVGNIRQQVSGEVLADLLQLAKVALEQGSEGAKNVAAVLAAAAYEDTIRRMGSSFCGIHTRDELSAIVIALKTQGVLQGAQFGTVQAQLQFRNTGTAPVQKPCPSRPMGEA